MTTAASTERSQIRKTHLASLRPCHFLGMGCSFQELWLVSVQTSPTTDAPRRSCRSLLRTRCHSSRARFTRVWGRPRVEHPTHPYPREELQVLPRGQLVKEDVVLGTDPGHLADLVHVVRVGHRITKNKEKREDEGQSWTYHFLHAFLLFFFFLWSWMLAHMRCSLSTRQKSVMDTSNKVRISP